ncbi:glycoside hydrolase family 31 protein [Hymenopellis radicata]|nr:glycoside hydrolase family 31 protein [Hymenopellis radicata]
MAFKQRALVGAALLGIAGAAWVDPAVLDACAGYTLQNAQIEGSVFTADLVLAGNCSVFGADIEQLSLTVAYETDTRIHLKITDAAKDRYEVPESVLPRPSASGNASAETAAIQFNYTDDPFSFSVYRTSTSEVLFSTASFPLIFEDQYIRVKTSLPPSPNVYGLGEHTDPFRLPEFNTTRTLWSRDAYGIPTGTNLYGNHPIYFEHRATGTHGVFLLNSNGMDIKLNETEEDGATLEYNVIGGMVDFYFLAGSETSPVEVAKQYAEVVGLPAEVPYWSFGFHQCRFGYSDFVDVAGVITNYSEANIPLETMWTDIDYMDRRRIFTVDPDYFPMDRMREIVEYLHDHDQQYILMTDPAVAFVEGYEPFDRGTDMDVWLKFPDGTVSLGLVWPGVTVYPDWFHPDIQSYWNTEFTMFYSPEAGLDIDGAWIDMNEPANFCNLPCEDPFQQAIQQALPPNRTTAPPDHDSPIFVNSTSVSRRRKRDLLTPQYAIDNAAGALSSKTAWTNVTHANGLVEYDTHNLYGTMMSTATREALLNRRPGLRTFVITRSTFPGAGSKVGKWLGDNLSQWDHYRFSIAGMLGMASIYQIPMVGSDICGFGANTTETLCARWAMLGAFYPFMRNHNGDTSISQEFYRWPVVAEAARNVLDIRYRLMDYIYTAFHQASVDGTPVLQPLWYQYPSDTNTYPIDLQFFYGDAILVSPVTEENSTSVNIYLPDDTFYDFTTFAPIVGNGSEVTLTDVNFTQIPVYIRSGNIVPLRVQSAMTTAELREQDLEVIVAIGRDGTARGSLYLDDGVSLVQESSAWITFTYANKTLSVDGSFGYQTESRLKQLRLLGIDSEPTTVDSDGERVQASFEAQSKSLLVSLDKALTGGFSVTLSE